MWLAWKQKESMWCALLYNENIFCTRYVPFWYFSLIQIFLLELENTYPLATVTLLLTSFLFGSDDTPLKKTNHTKKKNMQSFLSLRKKQHPYSRDSQIVVWGVAQSGCGRLCAQSVSTFRDKGKRKRKQGTGIQLAERSSYSFAQGRHPTASLIPVRATVWFLRKVFDFTVVNTLK